LVVVISTISIMASVDFGSGVCTLFATSISNITGISIASLLSSFIVPLLEEWQVPDSDAAFNILEVFKAVLIYSPQISAIVVLFASFIFIIHRNNNEGEIVFLDILWSFLCALIVVVSLVAAIFAVIGLVWVVIELIIAVAMIVAIILFFVCGCGGC